MTGIDAQVYDLAEIRPGDQVEVWHEGQLHYVARVEEAAPALEVAWVREVPGGYRKLVHARDTDLRLRASDSTTSSP